VPWEVVQEFTTAAEAIKGTASPVFRSKFCHFLVPRIFPVADGRAMGAGSRPYKTHYELVCSEWSQTDATTQDALREEMESLIRDEREEPYRE
jgi:hypothetical protein